MLFTRARAILAALSITALLAAPATLRAQGTASLTIGGQRSIAMLPFYYAQDHGLFKKAGLDVKIIDVAPGPASTAAVMNGETQLAWSASIPPILARAHGLPVRLVMTMAEEMPPAHATQWMVATAHSGIHSVADLRGKVVMINVNGGACELALRDRLMRDGIPWNSVRRVIVPFPQMQAAMDLGNADVACTIDVFYASMMQDKKIDGHVIATGFIGRGAHPVFGNGMFGLASWIDAHKAEVVKIGKVYSEAMAQLAANHAALVKLAVAEKVVSPKLAATMPLLPWRSEAAVTAQSIQPLIDAMARVGMLAKAYPASEVVTTLKY